SGPSRPAARPHEVERRARYADRFLSTARSPFRRLPNVNQFGPRLEHSLISLAKNPKQPVISAFPEANAARDARDWPRQGPTLRDHGLWKTISAPLVPQPVSRCAARPLLCKGQVTPDRLIKA